MPWRKIQVICLFTTAMCVFMFVRLFANWSLSFLVAGSFYMFPLYGTSIEKQMKTFVNVQKTAFQVNKMGNVIMNAFQNALPSKIGLKIMESQQLPCQILQNVNICYISLKIGNDNIFISKLNQYYTILDTLCQATNVQKIKCGSDEYICCTGAQNYLENSNNLEAEYKYQFDCSKIIITFALMAHKLAEIFDIECCCAITSGNVIMGAISTSSVINFDSFGDTVNKAQIISKNNNNGVFVKIDDFYHQCSVCLDDGDNMDTEFIEYDILNDDQMSDLRKIIINSQPFYEFERPTRQQYQGHGFINTVNVKSQYNLQLLLLNILYKSHQTMFPYSFIEQLDQQTELVVEPLKDIEYISEQIMQPEIKQYQIMNNSTLKTENNTQEQITFNNKQYIGNIQSNQTIPLLYSSNLSCDNLLKPNIQKFLNNAKICNSTSYTNLSQSRELQTPHNNISNNSEEILYEIEDKSISFNEDQVHIETLKHSSQENSKKIDNIISSTFYDFISIHKFMNSFSKTYCMLMCEKIDVFEIWVNGIDLKYSNYELIVVLMNTIFNKFMLTNNFLKIYLLSYQIHAKQTIQLLNYVYCIICPIFNLYQRLYYQKLKEQLKLQKQKYNKQTLQNLLWGKFHSANKLYQVLSTSIDVLKMIIFIKTILKYQYVSNQSIELNKLYIAMIANLYTNKCVLQAKNHFCSNMTPIITFNFWGKFLQILIKAIIFSISVPILFICYFVTYFMNTLLQYSKFKHIMIDSQLKSDLHYQIQHGKTLLGNMLPQIAIEALLLTTIEKDSKDLIILTNDQISKQQQTLLNIQQLIQYGHTPQLNSETISDLNQYRLCQMVKQHLIFHNSQNRPLINFGEVAYLNMNLSKFSQFSSQHSAHETLLFLQSIIQRFENRLKLTKNIIQVSISGDTFEFMCLPTILKQYQPNLKFDNSNLLLRQSESIMQLIALGLGFITDVQQLNNLNQQDQVGVQIGISYGMVYGSLLGTTMCKFDTFGEIPKRAEYAQTKAKVNNIMIDQYVIEKLKVSQCAVHNYIAEYIAKQQEMTLVKFKDEYVEFQIEQSEYGQIITKII
ncbi:Nucleotidyl_cyclase [Hexamita inflata]|uniref:Nucleotidyl cyclase n=1 Tax=Hexamita inflata TaxID=28002 RepID=A0AA86REB6_9EUKA|nr:Nucleotidyl cyclase [Hexamita inflata]CAI9972362.1 Nucleotidyl cyclase [Hexamita inflata]